MIRVKLDFPRGLLQGHSESLSDSLPYARRLKEFPVGVTGASAGFPASIAGLVAASGDPMAGSQSAPFARLLCPSALELAGNAPSLEFRLFTAPASNAIYRQQKNRKQG